MNSEIALWISLMLIGFMGSALYSGLETGAYRLNRVMLHIDKQRGNKRAKVVDGLLDHQTSLLSTLLIGNNITNQLGTASLAVLLSMWGFDDWQSVLWNTIIVTPILFVFGETLPKDLFAAHPEKLVYKLYNVLRWSKWAFTAVGLVPIIGLFTKCLLWFFGGKNAGEGLQIRNQPRYHIEHLVRESVGYGLLSDDISDMAGRVLAMSGMTIANQMVPWDRVVKVFEDDKPSKLWILAKHTRGSRYPVINRNGNVVGIIHVSDALVHEKERCPAIKDIMKKPFQLTQNMSVRAGLRALQEHHVHMGIVKTSNGKAIGIVTVKDLIEPITGELKAF